MNALYTRIIELCEARGIKGAKMCTDIGISKSTMTDLKMGRKNGLSAVNAQKIASYLNVSVAYLLGKEEYEEIEPSQEISYLQAANKLTEIIQDKEFIQLFESYRELDDKGKQIVKNIIENLK